MRLNVDFVQGTQALKVELAKDGAFAVDFGQLTEAGKDIPHYDGDYDVVPGREETTLETRDTVMDDDVTVHPIPFFEVSNLSGGTTCYIGGPWEIEISRRAKNGKK